MKHQDNNKNATNHHSDSLELLLQDALQKISEEEARHRFLFDNLIHGVVYQDIKGDIIYANTAAENILGIAKSELQGLNSYDARWQSVNEDGSILAGCNHPSILALKTGQAIHNRIIGVHNPMQNKIIWLNVHAIPYFKVGETIPIQVCVVFEDITGWREMLENLKTSEILLRKKNEEYEALNEELRETNEKLYKTNHELFLAKEQAEESDNLKTAFLRNMTHEVRTPLNSIMGFSDLLNTSNLVQNKIIKYTELINSNSIKLLEIMNDVIEISQIQSHNIRINNVEFNLYSALNELVLEYSVQCCKKGILFQYNLTNISQTTGLFADKQRILKIVRHLLENALKFTHKGCIRFDCCVENNLLEITVTDTGIGISKEKQKIIFEPFRQVEEGLTRNYGGNGLGLTIIKSYIELLGGNIELESEINQGSKFQLIIPAKLLSDSFENEYIDSEIDGKTILIAEDEYSNFEYLSAALGDVANVLHAVNGQEAVDICRHNNKIDIILMDVKMPLMDGETATKLIKAFRPEIPIIAISAYSLNYNKEQFIENQFDAYITKPISKKKLMQIIHKYVS